MPMISIIGGFRTWTGRWAPGSTEANSRFGGSGVMDPNPPIPLEDQDSKPCGASLSPEVDAWIGDAYENYADDVGGVQIAPLHDFELPADESVLGTSIPTDLIDELFEPGEFWFQTGPPTSLDDETGQTRGQTCLPDYLEPDDQIDPSDADWQNPTTSLDAICSSPNVIGVATSNITVASTTHSISLPSANVGDAYLVFWAASSSAGAITFPDGWEVVRSSLTTALVNDFPYFILRRTVDGTEGSAVDVTVATARRFTAIACAVSGADPFFGAEVEFDESSGNGNNPPALAPDWGATPWLVVAAQFCQNQDTITNFGSNMPMARTTSAPAANNPTVTISASDTSASSYDPLNFTAPASDSVVVTIGLKGLCLDGANSDPASAYEPLDLEPDAEPLQDGLQSQGPLEDGAAATVDDLVSSSVPDWLEPDAEPNPDDVGSGGWSMGASDDGIICTIPVVEAVVASDNTTGVSLNVAMPATVNAGDLLIIAIQTGISVARTFPSDWTEINPGQTTLPSYAYKFADGTEGGTSVSVGAGGKKAAIAVRISGVYPGDFYDMAVQASGSSAAPDSPSLTATPSFQLPLLWLAFVANGALPGVSGTTLDAGPAGYSNFTVSGENGTSTRTWMGFASRNVNALTEDPGAFTESGATAWVGDTFAIYGTCFGPPEEIGTNWTEVTEAQEDVFDEAPEWARSPTFEFDGDNEPAPRHVPDDLEPEVEVDAFGWQQSVVIEDFPLDPEIPLTAIPVDLEPEAEALQDGWQCTPLDDTPTVDDISDCSVPFTMELEDEPLQDGWVSAPLHDTPSTDDITDTSIPDDIAPDETVGGYVDAGWTFRLPDMEAFVAPPEPPAPGSSSGTLPGVLARRKWWIEREAKEEKARRLRGVGRWPNFPEPKEAPPWKPKVVTNRIARPRLDAMQRDWKMKLRKAHQADDAIIAALIAAILAEDEGG